VTGQLEKPSRVSAVRKDMARVLTVLREKRG
jgi:ribosomal protein L29